MKNFITILFLLLSVNIFATETVKMSLQDVVTKEYLAAGPNEEVDNLKWSYKKEIQKQALFYTVTINSNVVKDRGLTFTASVKVPREQLVFLKSPYYDEKVTTKRIYAEYFPDNVTGGHTGRFSKYPVGAVAKGSQGKAFAIDWKLPIKFRIEYDATKELFNIHFDFAAVPEQKIINFRFAYFNFNNTWGFRSALAKFYQLFDDFSVNRIKPHGMFVAFAEASRIQNAKDFHIRARDTYYEPTWNKTTKKMHWPSQERIIKETQYCHDNNIMVFRYHEPGNWWMPLEKGTPRTREFAEKQLEHLASLGHPRAKAILTSSLITADNKKMLSFSRQTWNDGCVWSCSTLPNLDAPARFVDHYLVGEEKINSYNDKTGKFFAGEFFDSMGGYMRDPLDFSRKNLAATKFPAVFDFITKRAAISLTIMQAEYSAYAIKQLNLKGKLAGANNVRSPLLSPYFDTISSETDWKRNGVWKVQDKEELMLARILCKNKMHTPHLNTDLRKFSSNEVEIFLKRNLAFGHIANLFNNRGKNYFRQPEYYNRDRKIFAKYMPIAAKISLAGWEPETNAKCNYKDVLVERFGNEYLTVFNDSYSTRNVILEIKNVKKALHFTMKANDLKVFNLQGKEIIF